MSSKINLQTCEYARKSSIFQDNQLICYKKYKTDKETGKIYSDDEVNKKIIEKSTTTNKKADEKAGVDR